MFDADLTALPEAFGDAGYETAGVSNNVWIADEFGMVEGFDEFREDGERTDAWSGDG